MVTAPPTAWTRTTKLALVAAVGISAAAPLAFIDAPQDDSYISYIYARNFARGQQLVYNAGDTPVEGYTNFLWTLLLGLAMRAGLDPEATAPSVGIVCGAAATALTAILARTLGASPSFAVLAGLLFAVRPTLAVQASGGLETTLFTLLLLGGILPRLRPVRSARDDLLSSFALAAATLTRPEGLLVFALLEAGELRTAVPARARTYLLEATRRALPFGIIVGLHFLWRYQTYGDWIPNTLHAKVAPSLAVWTGGAGYVVKAVLFFGPFLLLLPYLMAGERAGRDAKLTCLTVSTVYTIYVAYVGGDYIPTYRYLLPVMPLWCALGCSAVELVGRRLASPRLAAALLVILGIFHTVVEYAVDERWSNQGRRHRQLVAAGLKLNEILPPHAWLAVTAAGRIPYFADRRSIDMLGLSDRHIAALPPRRGYSPELAGHLKGDGRYVLDRRPDAIVFLRLVVTPEPVTAWSGWPATVSKLAFGVSEKDLVESDRFQEDFRLCSVPLPEVKAHLNFFARTSAFDSSSPRGLICSAWPTSSEARNAYR